MGCSCSPFVAAGIAAVFLTSTVSPTALSAQSDGTPIRLQTVARPGKWITGRSGGITADSVSIVPEKSHDTLRFGKSELARLEIGQGQKSNAGRGALIGAGAGLVAGLIWYAAIDCTSDNPFESACPVLATEFALITTASGAAGGALIGAFSHREKWKAARLEPHASVGHRGVMHVGLGVTF